MIKPIDPWLAELKTATGLESISLTASQLERLKSLGYIPQTIAHRLRVISGLLGGEDTTSQRLLSHPACLQLTDETLKTRVADLAAFFELGASGIRSIVRRHPDLLYADISALGSKITTLSALYGINRVSVLGMAKEAPQLLSMSPKTLSDNMERLAASLGCETRAVRSSFVRRPTLTYASTATIMQRLNGSARHLGMKPDDLAKVALKNPQILSLAPSTIADKANWIQRLIEVTAFDGTVADVVRNKPTLLNYSALFVRRRVAFTVVTPHKWTLGTIVCCPNTRLETELKAALDNLNPLLRQDIVNVLNAHGIGPGAPTPHEPRYDIAIALEAALTPPAPHK